MTQVNCTKYGIVIGILFLSTLMLSIISVSQTPILAQITPTPQSVGSNDAADSSHNTGASNKNPSQPITPSDGSADESTDSTDSNDVNNGQTAAEEEDSNPTKQLVEAIKNKVNQDLAASRIIIP